MKNQTLKEAMQTQNLDSLNKLINEFGMKADTEDLAFACEILNFDMIKILVESGVDINRNARQQLRMPRLDGSSCDSESNPLSVVCAQSSINPYDGTSMVINRDGDYLLNIVQYLIDHGADVNCSSPLMSACSIEYKNLPTGEFAKEGNIHIGIVELLIEQGADINYLDPDNHKSILMKVVDKPNGLEVAKILIENGADINHKDKDGNTALMYINIEDVPTNQYNPNKSPILMQLLIEKGADINARNHMGITPLMHYSMQGENDLVKVLLENGADINVKSEVTAFSLAKNEGIKDLINSTQNNEPQKLVHILSNFTVDKPVKYTTHNWDFGDLRKSEYKNFEGYMDAVRKQFENFADELKTLSPNLYKKIYTFLLDESPDENYSWSQKVDINIGWSSLEGLKEHCDNNMKPDTFRLKESFIIGNQEITTFGEVINFFKQEIEVRNDNKSIKYLDKSLEELFVKQRKKMRGLFNMDLSASKLGKQFYTDTEKLDIVLDSIFKQIKSNKQQELDTIRVISTEPSDNSIEIRIVHVGSFAPLNASQLLDEAKDGDFASIKENLQNICDWSCENSFEGQGYRVNYLHSNNVKDIEPLENAPEGFTHIMRFYTR